MKGDEGHITRRGFMHTAAAGLVVASGTAGLVEAGLAAKVFGGEAVPNAGAALGSTDAEAKAAGDGGGTGSARVVSVKSAGAFSGTEPDAGVVARMLEAGAGALVAGGAQLWRTLFEPGDVVGIKLNCISRSAKPNKALIEAVVAQLKAAGVRENNIIVWDRFEEQIARRARLTLNRGTGGVRVYGTEKGPDDMTGYDEKVYYETDKDTPEYRGPSGTKSLVTRIVTTDCTKIINMPVLKDHNQAGITACLKNMAFGSVNNTARFHKAPMYCSPAISDIYATREVREKTVLHVVDALRVCYNGGPDAPNAAYIASFGTIYLATDPVACDTIALEAVQRLRADAGLPDLFATSGQPVHVADAAAKGLGVGERPKIELVALTV